MVTDSAGAEVPAEPVVSLRMADGSEVHRLLPAGRVRLSRRKDRGPHASLAYTRLVPGADLLPHQRHPQPHGSGEDSAQGSARIQHGVRKRRETTGTNRVNRTRERAVRLGSPAARFA